MSVCLFVPAWDHASAPAAVVLLLGPVGSRYRSIAALRRSAAAAGECEQCLVVSVRSKLNSDLFVA